MATKKRWIEAPTLQPGDAIGVVAPAGPVEPGTLDKGVSVLRQMGFEPVPGRHVRKREGFLSGTDQERADDLMTMFRDPAIRAIVCARGGYGVNRVLPLLNANTIRKNPKRVVGSSDITLLLIYLNQMCRMVAYHGPMTAASFGNRAMTQSRKQFAQVLMGKPEGGSIQDSQGQVLTRGIAEGRLMGGNLTLMARSLGTPYEIETRGSILLIEDVNEPTYRIDGMLWQLKQAGKLKGLKGVILGEMIDCKFPKGQRGSINDVFMNYLGELGIPIVANWSVGHGREIWTTPMGRKAILNAGKSKLEWNTSGVV